MALSDALKDREIVMQGLGYPYPDGAMNIATSDFLSTQCDRMLVIDTDIIFKPSDVKMLLSHDVPFVAGVYPKKKPGLELVCEPLNGENPFAKNPFAEGVEPLIEVKRVARGFMSVHRSVFEKLNRLTLSYVDPAGKTQKLFWKCLSGGHSEDYRFCDQMRSVGIKVLVDQRVCVQHEGSIIFPIKGTY